MICARPTLLTRLGGRASADVTHCTMHVCQRNVARFAHVECRFEKIKDMFQGFGSLVSLRLQKDGSAKSKQIWTSLSHWNTGGESSCCEELFFFDLYATFTQLVKRDIQL